MRRKTSGLEAQLSPLTVRREKRLKILVARVRKKIESPDGALVRMIIKKLVV